MAAGLREDSRIKMKIAGVTASQDTILLGVIADRIGLFISGKNGEEPESIAESFYIKQEKEARYSSFDTPEAFKEAWNKITGGR